jgi:hypothetical protein
MRPLARALARPRALAPATPDARTVRAPPSSSSSFPKKMSRDDFDDKKFVFAGIVMLVGENEKATAYLTHESLAEVIENAFSGKKQSSANGVTDVVILADLEREPDFFDSPKGQSILKQCESDKRKTDIKLVRFDE